MNFTRLFVCLWLGALLTLASAGRGRAGEALSAPMDLQDAIKHALEQNPELEMMRQRLQVLSARAKQAPYLEDPEIAIQFGGLPLSHPTSFNRGDTHSIGIRQKLPFFGKLGLKEKIAHQESKVAEQELRAKEREIVAKVKASYAELFMAQRNIEILSEQSDILRTLIRATEARYQVGRVTQQDVFKALLEQSDLENQRIAAEAAKSSSEAMLNALMNRPAPTPILVATDLRVPEVALSPSELAALALANRAELKGAEEDIARTENMRELAGRNRKFPDFMVGWDYMRMPTDEMAKNRYGAMLSITIPFSPWTIGRRDHEIEETLAENRAAKANREAIRVMTLRDLAESRARSESARKSVTLYREGLLSQAELSFQAALAAYQSGRAEFINLLEAQRALREARMGYVKTLVSLMQSVADLERAVGKELP